MKNIFLISIFLLLLSLLSGNLGIVTIETNLFITFVLLILFTILILPINLNNLTIKHLCYTILCVSFIFATFIYIKLPLNLQLFFIIAVYLFLLKLFVKDTYKNINKLISVFLLTAAIYLIYLQIYFYVAPLWLILQDYAQFISKLTASMIGKNALFGVTTLGVSTNFLLVIFILVYHFYSKIKSITKLILTLVTLFIAQIITAPVQILVVSIINKLNKTSLITPMDVIFIPFFWV